MEPFNEDVENPTKKPNVSLSSLIILMSVEMKSSKALCRSGYFPDWISERVFMKIFSYVAGVDETQSRKVWTLAVLNTSSPSHQLTSPWEFLSGMRWLLCPLSPSPFFLPFPSLCMYANTYKPVAFSWCRKSVSQCRASIWGAYVRVVYLWMGAALHWCGF